MMTEIKIISLALAVISPLIWSITILLDGFRKQLSRYILFTFLLIATLIYSMTYAKFMGHLDFYATFFPLHAGLVLCIFPLFYLYVFKLTAQRELSLTGKLLHFIPSTAITLLFVFLQKVQMSPKEEVQFVMCLLDMQVADSALFNFGKTVYDVGRLMFVLSGLVYMFFSIRLVIRHFNRIRELFPSGGRSELTWLRALGIFLVLMMVFYVTIHVLRNQQVISNDILISVSYIIFAAFFWFIGFNGYNQIEVYNLHQVTETDTFSSDVRISREQIEEYLIKTRPYSNPDVSVFDFCYHFHTNRTYMSEAISKGFGLNFRGLINQYRIRDAVSLIREASEKGYDVEFESLAAKVGFSSYSTFLRVFKAELGITPTEHMKAMQNLT